MLSLREAYKALESAVHQVRLYLGTKRIPKFRLRELIVSRRIGHFTYLDLDQDPYTYSYRACGIGDYL